MEILASNENIENAGQGLPRPYIIKLIRESIEFYKSKFVEKKSELKYTDLIENIIDRIEQALLKKIGPVINGTGILVHTNLGRAPLSEQLFDRIKKQITGYGNLEFDVASGKRGRRGELAEDFLAMISGAEAGTIVNNNAAALFLIINTFANRRKVLISRGELVQIGGGFRIPDIIQRAGAKLVEVGTTNITSLEDYRRAIEEKPAMILKVHKSNFAMDGFTDEADIKSLVKMGKENDIPVVNDLGSGVLIDTAEFTGVTEPTVQQSVKDGAFLTCFSGDKLLGGIQAGLIVGGREYVTKVKKNPIYRAMRVDKTVFSAIEELLGYYLDDTHRENIKLWRVAAVKESELYKRGRNLLEKLKAGDKISLQGVKGEMGGGSLPEIKIPSVALVFESNKSAQKIASIFRGSRPPVIGRIAEDRFMLDLRTIDSEYDEILVDIIKNILNKL